MIHPKIDMNKVEQELKSNKSCRFTVSSIEAIGKYEEGPTKFERITRIEDGVDRIKATVKMKLDSGEIVDVLINGVDQMEMLSNNSKYRLRKEEVYFFYKDFANKIRYKIYINFYINAKV